MADGSDPSAWEHVVSDYDPSRPLPVEQKSYDDLYSAPRRFDLATMLVVTTAFAILFAGMKALDFPVEPFVYFAGLVTTVGIAQSLTYRHYSPRMVSIVVGILYYQLFGIFLFLAADRALPDIFVVITGLMCSAILGPIQGYIAGVLVGGTFLAAEVLREVLQAVRFVNLGRSQDRENASDESPWEN